MDAWLKSMPEEARRTLLHNGSGAFAQQVGLFAADPGEVVNIAAEEPTAAPGGGVDLAAGEHAAAAPPLPPPQSPGQQHKEEEDCAALDALLADDAEWLTRMAAGPGVTAGPDAPAAEAAAGGAAPAAAAAPRRRQKPTSVRLPAHYQVRREVSELEAYLFGKTKSAGTLTELRTRFRQIRLTCCTGTGIFLGYSYPAKPKAGSPAAIAATAAAAASPNGVAPRMLRAQYKCHTRDVTTSVQNGHSPCSSCPLCRQASEEIADYDQKTDGGDASEWRNVDDQCEFCGDDVDGLGDLCTCSRSGAGPVLECSNCPVCNTVRGPGTCAQANAFSATHTKMTQMRKTREREDAVKRNQMMVDANSAFSGTNSATRAMLARIPPGNLAHGGALVAAIRAQHHPDHSQCPPVPPPSMVPPRSVSGDRGGMPGWSAAVAGGGGRGGFGGGMLGAEHFGQGQVPTPGAMNRFDDRLMRRTGAHGGSFLPAAPGLTQTARNNLFAAGSDAAVGGWGAGGAPPPQQQQQQQHGVGAAAGGGRFTPPPPPPQPSPCVDPSDQFAELRRRSRSMLNNEAVFANVGEDDEVRNSVKKSCAAE